MTREQFEREKKYQAALAIARAMLQKGVVDEGDYAKIEAVLRSKFCPFIGAFQPGSP